MRSPRLLTRPAASPFALGLLLCFAPPALRAAEDSVIYVDAHATGPVFDGSSWCSAYQQLYEALAVATAGTTIRVADGTYKPDTTGLADPRTATMTLTGGVTLEGGYAGCDAADPDQRNIDLFRSTLSCDLASDDQPGRVNRAENCSMFFGGESGAAAVTVDGFTFSGSNVVALRVVFASATVRRCQFTENGLASLIPFGGAIRLWFSTSRIEHCVFQRNHARSGGAIHAFRSSVELLDCSFLENQARQSDFSYAGGAVYSEKGNLRISRCSFLRNLSEDRGGAIAVSDSYDPLAFVCEHSVFEENIAGSDGTLHAYLVDSLVDNCLFRANTTLNGGGAGIYVDHGAMLVRNCTIVENVARAGGWGAGLRSEGSPLLEIRNSVLWGNRTVGSSGTHPSLIQFYGYWSSIFDSCIMDWDSPDGDVMKANPLFAPGPGGCYYLSHASAGQPEDSPYVDAGAPNAADLGLADRTTRSDEMTDAGVVDLGYHYPVTGKPFLRGDFDRDSLLNLKDIAEFQNCFTGDSPDPTPPCCRVFDWTGERAVTLTDWPALATALAAP